MLRFMPINYFAQRLPCLSYVECKRTLSATNGVDCIDRRTSKHNTDVHGVVNGFVMVLPEQMWGQSWHLGLQEGSVLISASLHTTVVKYTIQQYWQLLSNFLFQETSFSCNAAAKDGI